MSDNSDFYIGWKDGLPLPQKRLIKRTVTVLFVLIPLLSLLIAWFQQPFNDYQFEFGNQREFLGIYHNSPQPILHVSPDQVPEGFSTSILLVGYGKFGAGGIIRKIEKEKGELEGRTIRLQGTLIYGDGKTLLELTENEKSILAVESGPVREQGIENPSERLKLSGEILDPKCYFGVMKPGEGKIHKSCAIRCISGGIAPVLRTRNSDGKYQYYLIKGNHGQQINQEILTYVAETIEAEGLHVLENGWDALYIDPADIDRP